MAFQEQNIIDFLNIVLKTTPGKPCGDQSREINRLPDSYGELTVKASVGMGVATEIPWISFTGYKQKTSNGIYPVILFYHKKKMLIVAFGVSKTTVPVESWDLDDPKTLKQYFEENDISQTELEKKYNASYVHSVFNVKVVSDKVDESVFNVAEVMDSVSKVCDIYNDHFKSKTVKIKPNYRPYITAIKSKPFLLLAGISGTGKSRIVRELARACWDEGTEEYKAHKPKNFEMVQVKPNWHDSSELLGYVSRVSGKPEFIAGDFLKFVAKAWENLDVPHFLCLDEMNLAPVEQYFAEYLSVVESRKSQDDGTVKTDAILKKADEEWYFNLTAQLTSKEEIRKQFNSNGITIPQNLIVVGTVNMDETTFSFSRKVLDRAMTIEMNEVNLKGGLDDRYESIGKLSNAELMGYNVEGVDVYSSNIAVCDEVIEYLQKINDELEGTPFKVAYRTRNEFLLYVVNNLPYKQDDESEDFVIQRALDEITSMKVLSRIEGDETKVSRTFLSSLEEIIKTALPEISESNSVSLKKLAEMKKRLESGYTSFWS